MIDQGVDIMKTAIDSASDAVDDQSDVAKIKTGEFKDADSFHRGSGQATVYSGPDGSFLLRLENLAVTNGPALHVYLSRHEDPDNPGEVKDPGFVDLGDLKGNRGNQNYSIPTDVNISDYNSVVIYCQPFEVVFSVAPLQGCDRVMWRAGSVLLSPLGRRMIAGGVAGLVGGLVFWWALQAQNMTSTVYGLLGISLSTAGVALHLFRRDLSGCCFWGDGTASAERLRSQHQQRNFIRSPVVDCWPNHIRPSFGWQRARLVVGRSEYRLPGIDRPSALRWGDRVRVLRVCSAVCTGSTRSGACRCDGGAAEEASGNSRRWFRRCQRSQTSRGNLFP